MIKVLLIFSENKIKFDKSLFNEDFYKSAISINDSKSYIKQLGYLGLRYLVLNTLNKDIINTNFTYNDYGKPSLPFIHFNISDSYNAVIVAISDNEIGVDIERVVPRNFKDDFLKLVLKENFNIYKSDLKYIYQEWTKYESYYKRLGTGISPRKIERGYTGSISTRLAIAKNNENYIYSISTENTKIEDIQIFSDKDITKFFKAL